MLIRLIVRIDNKIKNFYAKLLKGLDKLLTLFLNYSLLESLKIISPVSIGYLMTFVQWF